MEVTPLHQRKCPDCDGIRRIIRKECNAQWKCPTCYREGVGCTLEQGERSIGSGSERGPGGFITGRFEPNKA